MNFFFYCFQKKDPIARIENFDLNVSNWELIFLPIIVGIIAAAILPWVKLLGAYVSKKPMELIKNLQADSEQKAILHKERISTLQEKAIIEQAKRDEGLISEVTDSELLKATQKQLKELRQFKIISPSKQSVGERLLNVRLTAEEARKLSGISELSDEQILDEIHYDIRAKSQNQEKSATYQFSPKELKNSQLKAVVMELESLNFNVSVTESKEHLAVQVSW